MDKDLQQNIDNLLKLAKNNQTDEIYKNINEFKGSSKQKGDLFEYFLAKLYEGIGCKVEVVGGANDGGVDLVIYYGNSPSKVYAIVQAKNVKTRLTKKDLQSEYAKFFGNDSFPDEQASVEKYNCKDVIIISLNGYIKNTDIFQAPKKYKVHLYDRSYVEKLIGDYSNTSQKKCPFQLVKYNFYYVVVMILLILVAVASWFLFYKENVEELSNEMLERLNNTSLSSYVKQDCQNFNYPLNTCRKKLVYRYMKKYDSLEKGLMVYFCGETNFKRGSCGKYGKKLARSVLYDK